MSSNGHESELKPLVRRDTWLDQVPTPKIIDDFIVKHWYPNHFSTLAEQAQKLIVDAMKTPIGEGLEADVRCRAKGEQSLREKLKMRHEEKHYQNADDIWNDIHDLAGVRIILYMPSKDQREKAKAIIQSIWGDDVEAKLHEGSRGETPGEHHPSPNSKPKYNRRHLGYQAVHYRVAMKTLKDKQLRSQSAWKENDRVEIQVVSALGHAWAQAGHDVLYKSYAYGAPTIQEERILDSLNGIVLSGDLLLELFHELVMQRTKTQWTHPAEFNIFLHGLDLLQGQKKEHKFATEGLDVLFSFLKLTDQNYPFKVRNAIKDLGFGTDNLKLDAIIATYEPMFDPAAGMMTPICLIDHMMPDVHEERDTAIRTPIAGSKECCIMISALTLLQNTIGQSDHANKFLQESFTMTYEQIASLNFVLTHCRRQLALDETHTNHLKYEDIIKPDLQPAWQWFRNEAAKEDSICGLFLKLAAMGATKAVDVKALLSQLKIGPLSRSSTASMDDDADANISEC